MTYLGHSFPLFVLATQMHYYYYYYYYYYYFVNY
jgi:hypothetical protein